MCGFVFAYSQTGDRLPDQTLLDRMDTTIRHRGPDEHGQKRSECAVMGHRRLAIIDITGGQQPMCTPDGRLWIAFNGEIYNFHTIRDELAAAGHPVNTNSDTEVLLHAYLVWGEKCLGRLNGMFAFAIYDGRTQSVFAARDRFGEKPLYVLEHNGTLYLASELKALVETGLVEKRLDPVAVYNYFANSYVMGPRTIFRSVRRLQPGYWLKAEGANVREQCYWAPPDPTEDLTDEKAINEEVLDVLRDSVRLRFVSDVPVGFFLSGGVDSSAVVALANEVSGQRLETFSIGFNEAPYDERKYARYVADKFGTRHHEFLLEPGSIEIIEQIAWHADEPFADSSALPTWYLSQLTRQHVKVALSGDGGDEMFAGYDSYRGHVLSERLRKLPGFVRSAAVAAVRSMPAFDTGKRVACLRLARNIEDAGLEAGDRFVAKQQVVFRREYLAGISPYLAPHATAANDRALFASMFDHEHSPLAGMTLWQQTVSLADDMLVKVDRMSMAHSLEVRAPFLDHRLAELMNRVRFDTKLPRGRQKYLLRKAMERYFPAEFLWRKKQGFAVPLSYWFKDSLGDYIRQKLLAPGAMVGHVFKREALERIIGEHARLARDWSFALWTLLMFETWCSRYQVGPDALAT
ncbi:MAG TPA: asparagine synthase (glutamine-hydrolyzing) [Burkholderiales bacterium]|jgi:asparagine synthase (glutamine-hydrolysing)|nr:asparagine synthase (glutamine-hydrolyzing) [Burkholderiales bacterium]